MMKTMSLRFNNSDNNLNTGQNFNEYSHTISSWLSWPKQIIISYYNKKYTFFLFIIQIRTFILYIIVPIPVNNLCIVGIALSKIPRINAWTNIGILCMIVILNMEIKETILCLCKLINSRVSKKSIKKCPNYPNILLISLPFSRFRACRISRHWCLVSRRHCSSLGRSPG